MFSDSGTQLTRLEVVETDVIASLMTLSASACLLPGYRARRDLTRCLSSCFNLDIDIWIKLAFCYI